MKKPFRRIIVGLVVTVVSAAGAETRWFTGTDRAYPVSLTDFKDNGIRSQGSFNNESTWLWDLGLGTDVAMWDRRTDSSRLILGARFGIATRFEFGSESFDLWAADIRGGAVAGWQSGDWAAEALFLHESSHLGDEIVERGDRQRIDASINELRLSLSHRWGDRWRVYGSLSAVPWGQPDERAGFGMRLGGELGGLPPWRRAYVAAEFQLWDWRDFQPDAVVQWGWWIGPTEEDAFLSTARIYLQTTTGSVPLGQFYDETETAFSFGMALDW